MISFGAALVDSMFVGFYGWEFGAENLLKPFGTVFWAISTGAEGAGYNVEDSLFLVDCN